MRRCLTDKGACYRSTTWADALAATGTKPKRTRPCTPRANGKAERCHGTLSHEWAYVRDCTTERERRVAPAEFVNYYNHERPPAALGGRPPAPPLLCPGRIVQDRRCRSTARKVLTRAARGASRTLARDEWGGRSWAVSIRLAPVRARAYPGWLRAPAFPSLGA
ncbi:integrase core domain-containing protein [Streptomyces sp. NPDC087864]|uniref:integrase core domain-containing protein n=1 Tax=Streptomyces sp. NPDC087864 TaxID=3365814 RepID=UPI003806B8EF